MTKSTITRERIQRIIRAINSEAYDEEEIREWLSSDEIMELSRMALAAMDGEPVELPLDYLQGHKDGLEWAAQLAESNHPETGDWLYDDPIELAKAIRKGPDMPPVQPAPVVPGKWIPVSEQMPEDRTQVILWDAEIGEVTSGHYSHKTHTFYHCGDATENEITHWMAPPAAPQGVGDA
ncbi:DUF551 domain-containing protein [Klebsiella pneumoniae]|uniref:DUF551 domain-containing protein n=1 Tax=Klebsiella pneumoniae TaxID=573 RepID=UPI00081D214D|nr:hypothetical protein A8C02_06535 [Klebsiella pneumoniae]EIV2088665.1 DUF551 domain-containing protein [Klebsiella pneumoniae subsp. ozaenae]OKN39615.1 hypothetical protein AM418_002344 [Klebsiella pneumoniae]